MVEEGALVITGPTASGKSALALELAQQVDVEIISVDSVQVYRGMNIGTAKPTAGVLEAVPHHLVDIRETTEPYSAADFRHDVLKLVPEIRRRGRLPVIVGGTMLYLKALKEGLAELPQADQAVREEINELAAAQGWEAVHQELKRIDTDSAQRIKPTDSQRLQRAVEVYRVTGSTMTELHKIAPTACPFPLTEIGIMPPDWAQLYESISRSFHAMLEEGFVEEVAALKSNPDNHRELPAIRAVGYRQIWSFLEGDIDYDTMVKTGIIGTRQLAKRQYTWLRSWKGMTFQDFPDLEEVLKVVEHGTILN